MLVPIVDMNEFEKVGFKKCKKPYDNCYYLCFSKGIQYIFLSPVMIDIENGKRKIQEYIKMLIVDIEMKEQHKILCAN